MDNIDLFCFPYAGGSSAAYSSWNKYLNNHIKLRPIELAGRGKRIGTPFYNSFVEAVEDVFREIKTILNGTKYALFGHSMGAILIYELMNKIYDEGLQKPLYIFLSGANPPHIGESRTLHMLSDEKFKNEIIVLGGLPKEYLEHKEFLDFFIPLIKADFKIQEEYKPKVIKNRWDVEMSVFNGKYDTEVMLEKSNEWKDYTINKCLVHTFDGGHFFIYDRLEEVIGVINSELEHFI